MATNTQCPVCGVVIPGDVTWEPGESPCDCPPLTEADLVDYRDLARRLGHIEQLRRAADDCHQAFEATRATEHYRRWFDLQSPLTDAVAAVTADELTALLREDT